MGLELCDGGRIICPTLTMLRCHDNQHTGRVIVGASIGVSVAASFADFRAIAKYRPIPRVLEIEK